MDYRKLWELLDEYAKQERDQYPVDSGQRYAYRDVLSKMKQLEERELKAAAEHDTSE